MSDEALVRSPVLRTGHDAPASALELFFDLAYVLVVFQLAAEFLTDLSWGGLGRFGALFIAIWFSWVGFTLYANRFDTDDVIFRIAKLVATLAVTGCAASVSLATSTFSVPFAASFFLGRVVLGLLYARAWRHVRRARTTLAVYIGATTTSCALWGGSLAIDGGLRYALWAVAVVIDAVSPLIVTWCTEDQVPVRMEHLPERFGLLVILVLGQMVGGVATAVHDARWVPSAVAGGAAGFVVAAALWWNYFDLIAPRGLARLRQGNEMGLSADPAGTDERHDLFVYGHLPLTLGIVLAGIGIQDLAGHPERALPSPAGWILNAGVALFLAGAAVILQGTRWRWRTIWPWPSAALPVLSLLSAWPMNHALPLLIIDALICFTLAAWGTAQQRGG